MEAGTIECDSNQKNERLPIQNHFIGWQCRVRQYAMRNGEGLMLFFRCLCGYKFSEVWTGYDSRECQSDVKQTVNVDGLFVLQQLNPYSIFKPTRLGIGDSLLRFFYPAGFRW
jgi:hypothetical protein